MGRYQPKFRKKAKRGLSVFSACMLVFLACAVCLSAFVLAKYQADQKKDTVVAAKAFYFESDLLSEDNPTYTLAAGTKSITVCLRNHADALRHSEVNIAYKVTATGQTAKTGTLTGGKKSDADVTFDNLAAGTYTVTAEATSPYSEKLSATFVIPATQGQVEHSVLDAKNSPVLRLTVWSNDYSGSVQISWPEGTYPDNTDPLLANASNSTRKITVSFKNDAEHTFVFFKNDPKSQFTDEQFSADEVN